MYDLKEFENEENKVEDQVKKNSNVAAEVAPTP